MLLISFGVMAPCNLTFSSTTDKPGPGLGSPAGSNRSSPCVADIDGDGKDEIISGVGNALVCHNCDGSQRWARETNGRVSSSPAAWDVNGDGRMEIFVGNEAAWTWGFDSAGNNLLQWPKQLPPARPCDQPGAFSSPAIGDIDGDGSMEIVIGCWGMRLWAWHWQGPVVPGFPVDMRDTIWSSPAIGDVNGDGRNEIVIGSDCTAGPGWPYPSGGLVFVMNGAGQNLPGWPQWVPQVVWSSPALGDIDLARVMEPLPWSRSPPVPHRGATTLVCGPETQVAGPPSIATMRPGFNPRLRQMSPLPAAPTPTQQVQIVRTLQQQLQDLGYRISEVTGVPGTETQNAGAQLARDKRLTIPSNDVLALAAVVNREFARHFSA